MSDSPSQNVLAASDTRHSSFDDSIPTPTVKGQFDFSSKARFVHVVRFIRLVLHIPTHIYLHRAIVLYFKEINIFVFTCVSLLNRQRLELMREMYTNAADTSPTSPDRAQELLANSDAKIIALQTDPFYDRFPWFRSIGR